MDKVTKLFENHKYDLTEEERKDLKHRLQTKSFYLYKLVIETLVFHKIKINYQNVTSFIKLEIRIRNEVRNLIAAFEEAIWNQYVLLLEKEKKVINLKKISEKITLNKVINKLGLPILHLVREIRNQVSHLIYYIAFQEIKNLFLKLERLKEIDFIVNNAIDNLKERIKKHQQILGFVDANFLI